MWKQIAVATLLLLAGCSGTMPNSPTAQDETPTVASTESPTERPTSTSTPTPTATPEPTATPLPPAAWNPWEKQTVTVAIVDVDNTNRSYRPLVESALRFWERNANNSTSFEVSYEIVEDQYAADIRLEFRDTIDQCGLESDDTTVGCADFYRYIGEADSQTDVVIENGYNNESTVLILKHEFGHTLGLSHADTEVHQFMSAKTSAGTFPKPDVDERDWKWATTNVTVYADVSEAAEHRHEKLRDEVRHMVSTYNRYDHENIPKNASFTLVDEPEEADIVVRIVDETPSGNYADGEVWGVDPDEDGRLEYYTNATIYIRDAHHDEVGSFAGNWMGWYLYADDDDDLPGQYQADNLG